MQKTYSIKYYSIETNQIVKSMTSYHFNFNKKEVFAIARQSLAKHNNYNNLYYFKVFKRINKITN